MLICAELFKAARATRNHLFVKGCTPYENQLCMHKPGPASDFFACTHHTQPLSLETDQTSPASTFSARRCSCGHRVLVTPSPLASCCILFRDYCTKRFASHLDFSALLTRNCDRQNQRHASNRSWCGVAALDSRLALLKHDIRSSSW